MTSALARIAAIVFFAALYLADLSGMGMVGPDEPRYADVGRAMAQSGDWITPHLWGQPWFEKPALLYWMTGAGFKLGLGPDLAPRLPVALLSAGFLAFFWWRLRIEWGDRTASCATAMLATSAGWLTYSHVAVTDLPLGAFFSAAVLLALPWIARGEVRTLPFAAACLGLATLAKGLVPIVLFLPVFGLGWRRLRDWIRPGPLMAFSVCALPWYVLCTMRNGGEFLRVFFVEQQFGRFSTAALQHVQPWWFYVPVLLGLLFPWCPLIAFPSIGFSKETLRDPRHRVLASVVVFGFVFFSAAVNKLPGYLIPLLPAAFVLVAAGLGRAKHAGLALMFPVILLALLPAISGAAPRILAFHGLRVGNIPLAGAAYLLLGAAVIAFLIVRYAPGRAFLGAALLSAAGFLWFQSATFPQFDAIASARPRWVRNHPECAPDASRDLQYGLSYYAGRLLPVCAVPAGSVVH